MDAPEFITQYLSFFGSLGVDPDVVRFCDDVGRGHLIPLFLSSPLDFEAVNVKFLHDKGSHEQSDSGKAATPCARPNQSARNANGSDTMTTQRSGGNPDDSLPVSSDPRIVGKFILRAVRHMHANRLHHGNISDWQDTTHSMMPQSVGPFRGQRKECLSR